MPKQSAPYELSVGDEVIITSVQVSPNMDHLVGKKFVVVQVHHYSSTSRPIVVRATYSKDDTHPRDWYFNYDEVIPADDVISYLKYRKQVLDEKFKNLQKEFEEYQKQVADSQKKT